MSEDAKDAVAYGFGIICVTVAIWIFVNIVGIVFGGIGKWWSDITYVSPETKAQIQKERDEWEKDPLNPENIMRKCLDEGGYPEYHTWKGGDVTCDKSGVKK